MIYCLYKEMIRWYFSRHICPWSTMIAYVIKGAFCVRWTIFTRPITQGVFWEFGYLSIGQQCLTNWLVVSNSQCDCPRKCTKFTKNGQYVHCSMFGGGMYRYTSFWSVKLPFGVDHTPTTILYYFSYFQNEGERYQFIILPTWGYLVTTYNAIWLWCTVTNLAS